MNPVYVWLALVIVGIVAEILTVRLTSIWFALGALAALIVALLGGALWIQVLCFLLVTVLTMVLTRPLAIRYLKPDIQKTNVEAIPGKKGKVTEAIRPLEGLGKVKIDGQIWSAKAEDGVTTVEEGAVVTVVRVEGVKVVVRP